MRRLIPVLIVYLVTALGAALPVGALGGPPGDGGLPIVTVDPDGGKAGDGGGQGPEDRFRWFLWPLIQPGPLFTADWWKGMWGVQLTLDNLPVGALLLDCELNAAGVLRGVLEAVSEASGPVFSVSDAPAAATDVKLVTAAAGRRWQYLLRFQGLYPLASMPSPANEVSLGVGWKRDRGSVPWAGPVVSGIMTAGAKGVDPYAFVQTVGSTYLPVSAARLIFVPTVILASILGPPAQYPPDRLLSVARGASLQTRDLVGTLVDADSLCASFMGVSLSTRIRLASFDVGGPDNGAALYLGLNGWAASENLIERPGWMKPRPDGGVSAAVALASTVAGRPRGSPLVVKVGSRFSELRDPSHWRLDVIFSTGVFPTGPQSGIDWYW